MALDGPTGLLGALLAFRSGRLWCDGFALGLGVLGLTVGSDGRFLLLRPFFLPMAKPAQPTLCTYTF